MKKILVLNCGSSSIKYALYDMTDQRVITSGGIEKIGLPDSFITVKLNGEKHKMEKPVKEHTAGVQWMLWVTAWCTGVSDSTGRWCSLLK